MIATANGRTAARVQCMSAIRKGSSMVIGSRREHTDDWGRSEYHRQQSCARGNDYLYVGYGVIMTGSDGFLGVSTATSRITLLL